MTKCNIASIETLGLKDGPGIRTVFFLQGCNLRCNYCHNPEMWDKKIIKEYTLDEVIEIILRYKPYYGEVGGITVSGGEPLLQTPFLEELFKKCKEFGISTALDTAGVSPFNYDELLKYTDYILLDIKATNESDYKSLVHYEYTEHKRFIDSVNKSNAKVIVRQVIIPNLNDSKDNIDNLLDYIKVINNVSNIELLPYHSMAKDKYSKLGIKYVYENMENLDIDKFNELNEYLNTKKAV